jgi:hypothetical protein
MPLYEIAADNLRKIEKTSFGAAGVRERTDLQRLLRDKIDVILPENSERDENLLVIAEEFGDWKESLRRIDLLAVDKDANLVVIELKRTDDGGHMELQALRYAAMVSTMTFEKAVEVYANFLAEAGKDDDARQMLLDFLDWEEPDEESFAPDVRIILVSADFSKELTTAVLWLISDHDLDIRCVRLKPYKDNGRVLLDVQQVIPLPEAREYQVQVTTKNRQERNARASSKDFTKFDVTIYLVTNPHLAKRNAIFCIVKSLCDKGVKPEAIAELIHWRARGLFLSFEGRLDERQFAAAATAARKTRGKPFEQRRWFCDEGELIYHDGRTYAFSNQWGDRWREAMDLLVKTFPDAKISYHPSEIESD